MDETGYRLRTAAGAVNVHQISPKNRVLGTLSVDIDEMVVGQSYEGLKTEIKLDYI